MNGGSALFRPVSWSSYLHSFRPNVAFSGKAVRHSF